MSGGVGQVQAVELDAVLPAMKKSEYWTLALGQFRCNASEKVIWQLLDGACGSPVAAGA